MEPMTLGSPMGSPAQSPTTTGGQSAYLPGFLLGDNSGVYINIIILENTCPI